MSACEWEVRKFLILMSCTGIDLSPALRIRKRDFSLEKWTLFTRDSKNRRRKRTINLSAVATYCLKLLTDDKAPGEKAFTLSNSQIRYRWRKAREGAKLTAEGGFSSNVRLKDLRHTFAVHYLNGGGNLAGLANRMGHARQEQSLQYAKHESSGLDDMQAAARSMGLRLPQKLKDKLEHPEQEAEDAEPMPLWWFDRNALPRDPEGESMEATNRYRERGTANWADDREAYYEEYNEKRRETG